MPINTTGVNKRFLPMFTPSGNLSADMRKIELAKSISFSWLKGQFARNMRNAGQIIKVDGKEYFSPVVIRGNSYGFFTEGTKGYWIAESLRLLGYDDISLKKLADASNGDLDNIIWVWRKHKEHNSSDFSYYADLLRQKISGVDSIEIEYELDRYDSSIYTTEASRVYVPKSTSGLPWGTICLENPSIYTWSINERYGNTPSDIIHKDKEYIWGKLKLLSSGVDVTSNYSTYVKNAIIACIAYSGNSFMTRLSHEKIGERSYTIYYGEEFQYQKTFISAIGKETFDPSIKQEFIDDTSEIYWKKYSAIYYCENYVGYGEDTCYAYENGVGTRKPLIKQQTRNGVRQTYSQMFWELSGHDYDGTARRLDLVDNGEEFLFREYNYMSAIMNVDEFMKLNITDFSFYMGKYFDFDINYNNGTFVSKIVGAIANIFSFLIGVVFDIFFHIPVLRQMMQINTILVNTIFGSDLTEKELFEIQVQVALVAVSYGQTTTAISAGQASATTAGSTTTLTASEQVAIATANTSAITTASATIASAFGMSLSSSMAFATYVNALSSSYAIYQSIENVDKRSDMEDFAKQQTKEELLEEARMKQKEKDYIHEKLKQQIRDNKETEELNFLKNPLYLVDNEFKLGTNAIEFEINKQFNLI